MAYNVIWEIEVRHEGLSKYRHIRVSDSYVVEKKAEAQKFVWEEMWQKKQIIRQTSNQTTVAPDFSADGAGGST